MLIQTERIWLFETGITDPYFMGSQSGVTAKMVVDNPRIIEQLSLEIVYFYVEGISRGGVKYTTSFGGEDVDISASYGKSEASYSLEMNIPSFNQLIVEEMIGKEFSLLAMRRDLSHFVIFGRFEAEPLTIDNEVQQRVTFKSRSSNARIYDVQSFDITEVVNVINEGTLDGIGFDYNFDFGFN